MSPAAVHSAVDGTPTGTVHSASAGARPSKVKAEETTLTRAENPFADAVPWSLTGRCSKENRSSGDLGVERRADHDGETARERISDSPDQLWKHHTQGLLDPVELALPVPEDATVATRLVAADLALLLGLRLAVGDLRPVPYAIRWRAGVLGLSHTTVRRALSALVEAGALVRAEPLPADRGYPRGTVTFLPPPVVDPSDLNWVMAPVQLSPHAAARAQPGTRHWYAHGWPADWPNVAFATMTRRCSCAAT